MTDMDYTGVLERELARYEQLSQKRSELDHEIANAVQFINATLNMLPESKRSEYEGRFVSTIFWDMGLTDAIREVLQGTKKWMTTRDVRDSLKFRGFNFSRYQSSPLASVHAVLKRLAQVEKTSHDGVTVWRWKGIRRFPRRGMTVGELRRFNEKKKLK